VRKDIRVEGKREINIVPQYFAGAYTKVYILR
jgi:hypothetical protein